jgi:hypothetical protein
VDEAERILDSCNGDLGPSWLTRIADAAAAPSYGSERRRYQDPQYAGPERRLVGV